MYGLSTPRKTDWRLLCVCENHPENSEHCLMFRCFHRLWVVRLSLGFLSLHARPTKRKTDYTLSLVFSKLCVVSSLYTRPCVIFKRTYLVFQYFFKLPLARNFPVRLSKQRFLLKNCPPPPCIIVVKSLFSFKFFLTVKKSYVESHTLRPPFRSCGISKYFAFAGKAVSLNLWLSCSYPYK